MKRDHIWYIFADFTVCAYKPCDTWSAGAAAKFLFQVFKDDIVIHALRRVCVRMCVMYIFLSCDTVQNGPKETQMTSVTQNIAVSQEPRCQTVTED